MSDALTKFPVKKTILSMTAPAAFGMLMTFMFQLVDTYFIGKLGTLELAAISFSYPVYLLVVSAFMGLAAGISSTVGKSLGEGNLKKAKLVIFGSQIQYMIVAALVGVAGYFSIEPIFKALGANDNSLTLIADYMEIIYFGMFALVGTLIANSSLMAKGVMIPSTIVMGIGGIVNLVLDYVLIFGFGEVEAMHLKGAALATVISWLVTLVLMNALLIKEGLFSIQGLFQFAELKASSLEVLKIGSPAVAAQVLNPIAIAVITRMVSGFGEDAVAGYGIATRIESLGLTGILSLSVIMTPLVAQNFGAKIGERIDEIIIVAGKFTVYWSVTFYLIVVLAGVSIANIFTQSEATIEHISLYFIAVGISFPAFGLTLITTSFFNGVYEPKQSLKLTLVKSLGLTIPFAIAGSFFGVLGIWIGIAISNVISTIYADRLMRAWQIENGSQLVGANRIQAYVNDLKSIFGGKKHESLH